MEILWAAESTEVTAREVADQLPGYAYTTIATVLNRLTRKGRVRRRMVGRVTRFEPVDTEAGYAVTLIREALAGSADPTSALREFARTVTPSEARVLRKALEQAPLT
jgi:BlaI family transcriptional regulator, penicillinase repressor